MAAHLRDASAPRAPAKDAQGRPLPHDADAERKVLACVLHTGDIAAVRDLLTIHDFFVPMHGEIWQAMVDLDSRDTDPTHDSVLVALRVAGRMQPEMVELTLALRKLEDSAQRSLVDLARRVAVLGLRRRALGEMWHAYQHGYAEVTDDRAWLERHGANVLRIVSEVRDVRAYALDEAHDLARATVAAAHGDGPTRECGLQTGITGLDEHTSGLHRGELTLLSGPTGRGKSALSVNVALNLARAGTGVLYLQLEDTAEALATRAACIVGRLDSKRLRGGHASIDERAAFGGARVWMRKTPFQIVDDTEIDAIGVTGAIARARIWMHERAANLGLVIVDYLQLVSGRRLVGERANREQEVSAVGRALTKLAGRERVAVLALSQTNDDGEIRESRAVLHHAANWLDLQVPKRSEHDPADATGLLLKVRKQRHGPAPVNVPLWFYPQHGRFVDAGGRA